MITIKCKYTSVLILRTVQLGPLINILPDWRGDFIVSNQTNLIRNSNKYCCKYNRVVYVL